MTLIAPNGKPLTEDKTPKFVFELRAVCPRDNAEIKATAQMSGLAPIGLGEFIVQALQPTVNGFQQKVVEHEALHAVSQGAISAEGQN